MTMKEDLGASLLRKKLQIDDTSAEQQGCSQPRPKVSSRNKARIVEERLRQARCGFNLALIATGASACICLIGAGLLLSGKRPEGAITTASGAASSIFCIRLAKDANDRLDKLSD